MWAAAPLVAVLLLSSDVRPCRRCHESILMAEDYALASWYGPGFDKKLTASGDVYDQMGLTAAHKTLPLGTKLRLYNPDTKKAAVVTVNDRGPYVEGRDLDLSKGAAQKLGTLKGGVAKLQVKVLSQAGKDTPAWQHMQPAREAGPLRDNPEGGDNAGIVVPGMPPELLGPTGRVFLHPDGQTYSTHLNTAVPMDGKTAIVPMLVPGQTEVDRLLAGKKPSHEQMQHALDWVKTFRDEVPTYDTPEAAKADEKAWHDWAVPQMDDWVKPFLGGEARHNTEPMDRGQRMNWGSGSGPQPGAGMNRGRIGWSSPDPGSPNPTGPGPFDPGGGPGAPSYNFDPNNQTPWQRKNAGAGDTSTTLDPKTWIEKHPNIQQHTRRMDQLLMAGQDRRSAEYTRASQAAHPEAGYYGSTGFLQGLNDFLAAHTSVQPYLSPQENAALERQQTWLAAHKRQPSVGVGRNIMGEGTPEQQLFGQPNYNPGRGILR